MFYVKEQIIHQLGGRIQNTELNKQIVGQLNFPEILQQVAGLFLREPVVACTFYPSNPVELKMQLATFFVVAENKTINENATATILLPLAGLG